MNSPFVNVLLLSIFWSLQIISSKLAFNQGADPITLTFFGAIASTLFLFLVVLIFRRGELKNLFKSDVLKWIIFANVIHFGIGGLTNNFGIANTLAINSGFLVKFAMVTTILLAAIFLDEKITKAKLLSVLLMIGGAYLISTQGKSLVPHWGDVFIILACLAFSTGNIIIRKNIKDSEMSGEMVALLRPISGIPLILIFSFISGLFPSTFGDIFKIQLLEISLFPYIIVYGIFGGLLWIFLNRSLKFGTASYMTMMSSLTSVFVIILAILILGESLNIYQIIGGALIIFSASMTQLKLKV